MQYVHSDCNLDISAGVVERIMNVYFERVAWFSDFYSLRNLFSIWKPVLRGEHFFRETTFRSQALLFFVARKLAPSFETYEAFEFLGHCHLKLNLRNLPLGFMLRTIRVSLSRILRKFFYDSMLLRNYNLGSVEFLHFRILIQSLHRSPYHFYYTSISDNLYSYYNTI